MAGLASLGDVATLDDATTRMGTSGTAPPSQAEMAEKRKKCSGLIGEKLTSCVASTRTHAGKRRKTRARRRRGGGLRLFTRRQSPPPRPHTSYVGYANKSPLEGPHRPIPTEWMKKHRDTMGNRKKGARRRSTRRGARASRKRPTR